MWILASIGIALLSLIMWLFFRFRLTKGERIHVEGEMIFQVIDLGYNANPLRFYFESILNNSRIFLINDQKENLYFYVKPSVKKKCWPKPPLELKKENKTIKVQLEVKKLMINDYSLAKVLKIEWLDKPPIIRK